MIKLLLCSLFAFSYLEGSSQKLYYIYLQSEQQQPFFVKIDEKVHSSTGSGYLILSRLHDSTYNFSVGFPAQKWPEQKFSVTMGSKDHGFLLKNFGEKGWGLFNIQTLAVQMAIPPGNKDGTFRTEKKEVSAFTDILARAADDPSLRETTIAVVKKEEPKIVEPQQAIIKTEAPKETDANPVANKPMTITETPKDAVVEKSVDPAQKVAAKTEPVIPPANTNVIPGPGNTKIEDRADAKEPVVGIDKSTPMSVLDSQAGKPVTKTETADIKSAPADIQPVQKVSAIAVETEGYKRSNITKAKESSTSEGVNIVFIDDAGNGSTDTISIIIPNPKGIVVAANDAPAEKKFLDINAETPKENVSTEVVKVTPAKTPAKNACKAVATDNDFLKLRKKMVSESDDDDMIDEARKYFKTMCFSTAQVKNLGVLFLDDLGKYKFFDMAYLFVSDIENFSALQSELKNEYYVNRFKAILGNR